MMPAHTMSGKIILLLTFSIIAPAYAHGCRAISIAVVNSFNIPGNDDCKNWCNEGSMTRGFSAKLKLNDACQGANGFSALVAEIKSAPCASASRNCRNSCRCTVSTTAFRVHKDNQYKPDQGLVSCRLSDYVSRVTQTPFVEFGATTFASHYSLGSIQNDDVHCNSQ
ncbi:hypothetical protein M3J07_005117 [Ascochyta lentis]